MSVEQSTCFSCSNSIRLVGKVSKMILRKVLLISIKYFRYWHDIIPPQTVAELSFNTDSRTETRSRRFQLFPDCNSAESKINGEFPSVFLQCDKFLPFHICINCIRKIAQSHPRKGDNLSRLNSLVTSKRNSFPCRLDSLLNLVTTIRWDCRHGEELAKWH